MWPSHKTQRKGWWCRAFATAINRQCPTCNRLWTTEQFPPSLTQCLTCSRMGTEKKPSKFKLQDNQVGLIFRSAPPEELEWETRAEDVALSLDAIKRCLSNMLTALDRDTPQTKNGLAPHINFSTHCACAREREHKIVHTSTHFVRGSILRRLLLFSVFLDRRFRCLCPTFFL